MRHYFADVSAALQYEGKFTAEQYKSGRRRGGLGFTDGCNTYFQGLVADLAKEAVYYVVRACYTRDDALEDCRVVAFIHDEVILEAPIDKASEAADRLVNLMVDCGQRWLPDVPLRAEATLMERWYKSAEPTYDSTGRLVPWRPPTCE